MNFDLLKRLTETPGIPGYEDQVRDVVLADIGPLVDDVRVDALGNVIATKRGGGGPRVMLAGHMDEIGFIVRHIDDKGFLRLQPVGGFDPRVLVAQRVIVHSHTGERYRGVLQPATKPIHLLAGNPQEAQKVAQVDEFFVDLGLSAEAVKSAVELGDMVTLDRTCERVGETVVSKALDDRVSVFIMIEALRAVGETKAEIVAVATTQEEVGLRGATTAAYAVEPDIAVALDTTLALDVPGLAPENGVTTLGAGPAIKLLDSSHISNRKLVRHFRDIAERHGIPYQLEILPRGGTDAGAMQRTHAGVPAITLSTPSRYVHTVNEMVSVADVENAITLLARFLEDAGSRDYGFESPR